MRALVRWLGRLAVTAMVLAVLVLGAALITAHTGWGREQLRRRIEAALAGGYPGGARIGALDGNVLGALTLHGVELGMDAARGSGVRVRVGTLRAEVALWPLLVRTARIEHLIAEDVHVIAGDWPATGPAGPAGPPWRVELPDAAVRGATLELARVGIGVRDLGAAFTLVDDGAGATRLAITATAGDARVWATVRVEPAPRSARVAISATAIDLGLATGGRLRGRGNLLAVVGVRPDGARGALLAYGEVDAPDLPVRRAGVAIAGGLDRATAVMLGTGDEALQAAAVAVAHAGAGGVVIDEARAIASAQGARVSCMASDPAGALPGPGPGPAGTHPRASADAAPPCRRIAGELTARVALSGTLAPRPDLWIAGVAAATQLAIDSGPAAAAAAHASRSALRLGAVRSPFRLHVTAGDGAGLGVAVTGDVTATAVAANDITVAAAQASYALALAPEIRLDRGRLAATGIRRGGEALGDAFVDVERRGPARSGGQIYDASATARRASDGLALAARAAVRKTGSETGSTYRAELSSTRVVRGGLDWSGQGGTLTVADPTGARAKIDVRGVALRRGDTAIELGASYTGATGALDAYVNGDRIDVSALDDRARGRGHGALALWRRGGQWAAHATLAIPDLALGPEAAPTAVTADLSLARRRLTALAHAGPAPGGLDLALDATAPRDPLDLAAWRGLDRDAIHRAAITAHQVALPQAMSLFGLAARPGSVDGSIEGTIDGTVDLTPTHVAGAVTVRGIATPFGAIDGDVEVAGSEGDLEATASARLAGIAAADLTARFAIPRYPLDAATWQSHGRDLLRRLTANLADVAFDAPLLARLGLDRRLAASGDVRWLADRGLALPDRGRIRAAFELGGEAGTEVGTEAGNARLSIDLADLAGGALVAPAALHLAVSAGPVGTHVHGELGGRELDLGILEGDLAMTTERWLDEPAAALRAPLAVRWALAPTSAASVMALFGRRDFQAGTLEGSAMLCGSLAAPVVPGPGPEPGADPAHPVPPCGAAPLVPTRLVARDLAFARRPGARPIPTVRELSAAAAWDGDTGRVTIDGRTATGELHASVTGRPDATAGATGQAAMRAFDIASIAAFLPGWPGSASGTVDGKLELRRGGGLAGDLVVTDGALSFPGAIAKIGALRNARARLSTRGGTVQAEVDGELARGKVHLEAEAAADLATVEIRKLHLDGVSPVVAPRPILTADLTATLHRTADQWTGKLRIEGGSITLTDRTGGQLLDAALPADLVVAAARQDAGDLPPAPSISSSVSSSARSAPRLVLDVAPARLHLDAQIPIDARELVNGVVLTGTLSNPAPLTVSVGDAIGVRGKLEIASDDLKVLGRTYQLEDTSDGPSGLVFDGTLDPLLDLRMSHRFPDLTLRVDVRTRLSRRDRPMFSSDIASYTENQLFSFFLGSEPGDATPNRSPVTGFATRWLSGQVGSQLSKVLPITLETSCDPDPTATTATLDSCTIGTRILDRLLVTYRRHLQIRPDENANDVDAQFQLGGGLLFEGTGGDRGHFSGDLLLGKRW